MNKLPHAKRVQILSMLCEGSSMRSISRVADVSINTVAKILADAGEACEAFHDETVRNVNSKRIQCDEIWSFVLRKAKNVETAKAAPDGAGDCWTWTAVDADTKLMVAWEVGSRDAGYATEFMQDVASRLANRVQLTTDGHKAYLSAVEDALAPRSTTPNWLSCMAKRQVRQVATARPIASGSRKLALKGAPIPPMSQPRTWSAQTLRCE